MSTASGRTGEAGAPPPAAVQRVQLATHDADEGHEFLRKLYTEHRVRFRDEPNPFIFRSSALVADGLSLASIHHSASVLIDVAGGLPVTTVVELRSDELRIESRETSILLRRGEVAILPSGAAYWGEWDGYDASVVGLDDELLRRDAAEVTGGADLVFDFGRARSKAATAHWSRTTSFARATLGGLERAGTATPLALRNLSALVNSAALLCFPNSGDNAGPAAIAASPAAVRRAITFIDAHLDQPIDLSSIAEAARLSPRGLQAGFRRHVGSTPMAYLRRARLAQARAELLAGAPDTSVLKVAARWGWSNAGRFARAYQDVYGHPPRYDLR